MGKSSPQPPPAPDPKVTIPLQTQSNINTASAQSSLNAVNQVSPYGTVNFDKIGEDMVGGNAVPRWQQTISLSPGEQAIYDKTNSISQQALDTAKTGVGNVQNTLASPFSLQGLPALQSNAGSGAPQAGYRSVSPNFGIPASGNIQTSLGNPGNIQSGLERTSYGGNIADVGGQQRNIPTQPLQSSFADVGGVAGAARPTGAQTALSNAGQVQSSLNPTGLPGLPGAGDFSKERQAVEDAYLSRFTPDFERNQANTVSRLNAQGLQQGSEAYGTEMELLNRQQTDARNQAILAGGAEHSRLFGLSSNARGQLFGEQQAQGNFANAAQGQKYGQALGAGQFENQGLQQRFGQEMAASDQANQAQNQAFGQAQTRAGFANDASSQMFGQEQAAGQFRNQAQALDFGQADARRVAANDASSQTFGQELASGQFRNQSQAELYSQLLGAGEFYNTAQGQKFGQNAAGAEFYNQAANQATAQNQGQGAFYNTAQQQSFDQAQRNATLQNQTRQQGIAEQQIVRNQPINELATLLGLGGQVQTPTGAPNFGIGVGQTDVLGSYGLQAQAQQAAYQAQLQSQNAMWGGLGNLGGAGMAAMLMSDARLKNIIRRVGETKTGIPLWLYTFKGSDAPVVGVIAQEVRQIKPFAVRDIGGTLHVNYAEVA